MAYKMTVLSASGLVKSGAGAVFAVVASAPSTGAITVDVMNETGAAGDKLLPTIQVPAGETVDIQLPGGVAFGVGCYVSLSGSGEVGISFV